MIFKERNMAMVFNKTTNYDLNLASKTCQRHLETRAANVWDRSRRSVIPCLSLFVIFSRWMLIMHKPN